MQTVSPVDTKLFEVAFERWIALSSRQTETYVQQLVATARDTLAGTNADNFTESQMLLAIVAYGMISDECVRDALITRIEAFIALLNDPERRSAVKTKLAQVIKSLGEPGASRRAAKAVLSLLQQETVPTRAALAD